MTELSDNFCDIKTGLRRNMAENGQNVRGMIVCKEITGDLSLACNGLSDIELFEYELEIKLHKREIGGYNDTSS